MFNIKAFENVKNQIGYCGIWCGSCSGGNGSIQELARRFEDIVKTKTLRNMFLKNLILKNFRKGLLPYKKCLYVQVVEKVAGLQRVKLESVH
ncbi:MAG: hypothetical protein FGF50_01590 [Candidatus Brockarchaeota archaeon]|nr:hypothetical protein [Candidatus Brockarchaeota archaeon]